VKLWTTGPVEMWISAGVPSLARSCGLRWRPLNGSPGRWPHTATRTGLRRYCAPGPAPATGMPSLVHVHLPGHRRAVSRSASQPSQAAVGAGGCAPTAARSPTPDTRTCSPLLQPRSPAVPPAPGRAARAAAPPGRQGRAAVRVTWREGTSCLNPKAPGTAPRTRNGVSPVVSGIERFSDTRPGRPGLDFRPTATVRERC
jgi:hypothetical protein